MGDSPKTDPHVTNQQEVRKEWEPTRAKASGGVYFIFEGPSILPAAAYKSWRVHSNMFGFVDPKRIVFADAVSALIHLGGAVSLSAPPGVFLLGCSLVLERQW